MTSHGFFHWNELLTPDVEVAKEFFAETIGWTHDGMDMGTMTYWVAKQDGKPVAGLMTMPSHMPEGTPAHWMSYLAVDDIDTCLEKAKASGSTVLSEPFDVPDVGRIAILKDPTGAIMGWMTPAE